MGRITIKPIGSIAMHLPMTRGGNGLIRQASCLGGGKASTIAGRALPICGECPKI